MGTTTAYTDFEAKRIGKLPWYQDSQLINVVTDFVRRNHASVLFDLCCGTGQLYPILFQFYDRIHAVDLSPEMIQNNIDNNLTFAANIDYSCSDSVEFIATHSEIVDVDGDILFKNCLQFLDIPTVINQIKKVQFNCCFVINTINKSSENFFDLLRACNFEFTNRTKNYLTEEILDTYCEQIGVIKESACVKQQIPLVNWLKYHECNEQQISILTNSLSSMDQSELYQYGLDRTNGAYMLQRFEKVYCIKKY